MDGVPFEHLSGDELDEQHSPSRSAKNFLGVLQRHEKQTLDRDGASDARVIRDVAWGSGPAQTLDVYEPIVDNGLRPCVIHLHGGFWQEGSKAGSGFPAEAMNDAGWVLVGAGYTLAPGATLGEIVDEIAAVVCWVRDHGGDHRIDPSRIAVTGHSAGGHLGAALLAGISGDEAAQALAGLVLISGVYDLAPVAASYVNDAMGMDDADVVALSVLGKAPVVDVPVRLVVGADEPDTFQAQTDALHRDWTGALSSLTMQRVPGRDHFDILDELAEPGSATFTFLADLFNPQT